MINDCGDKPVNNSVEVSLLVKIGCCFFFLVSIGQRTEQGRPWRERDVVVVGAAQGMPKTIKHVRRLLGSNQSSSSIYVQSNKANSVSCQLKIAMLLQ